MRDVIVVIGGYGHVGATLCQSLGERFPGKVYAAGRSLERAQQFTRRTEGKVKPLQIRLQDGFEPDLLERVKLVVMCLDQSDTAFVRYCFQQGIHYVDISANGAFLDQVEALREVATANQATAVLSVGLAPGLTNLLARQAVDQLDAAQAIDISIMLGLGDQHGKAAIEWTVDNLRSDFQVTVDEKTKTVSSFTEGKDIDFGLALGKKRAYRFNFSDQHIIPRTLDVPTVSTRLCFDSNGITRILALLRRAGLFRLLHVQAVRRAVVALFGKLRFGSEMFAVSIDAYGLKDQLKTTIQYRLQGKQEAAFTAQVAAAVAARVYRNELPYGVYHTEQVLDWGTLAQDITFTYEQLFIYNGEEVFHHVYEG